MRHLSRRSLLLGASLLALSKANAGINNPGSSQQPVTPGFNGGITQINTLNAQNFGQYVFINFMKAAGQLAYNNPPTDTTAPGNPILELDANGYPTSIPPGVGAFNLSAALIPNANRYSGRWVLKWDGTGTAVPANFSFTTNLTQSNRVEFTNNDISVNGTNASVFITATSVAPNNLKNLRLCRIIDEAAMDAGQVFFPDHLALMRSAKPGSIRSLGWGGGFNGTNDCHLALWAHRRPVGYITYEGEGFFNPNWWGGTTTNSGTDYSLAYGGFSLTDKVIVQLRFNVSSLNNASNGGRTSLAWSTTNTIAINVAWPAHGFAVGNTVMFGDTPADTQTPPAALKSGVIYFVNNVIDANNFTVSATSGGSSVVATATTSGTMWAIAIHRININGTGFVPMSNFSFPIAQNIGYSTAGPKTGGTTNNVSTLLYDAITGWFTMSGPGAGLNNGSPPETFVDYCAAIGSHPWMVIPFMSASAGAGGCTDYVTNWVSYAKNTYPWMKPLVEPPNETWNGNAVGYSTFYAPFLAQTLWGVPGAAFIDGINQSYGKWVSDIGQAVSAVFGNDRTKYSMICASQASTFNGGSGTGNDNRAKSAAYVAAGGSAGYLWTDRVCTANYYSPLERFTVQEVIDAFNYTVTNAGNSSAQSAIAESYAATADTGANSPFNLTWNLTNFTTLKSWAQGLPGGNTIKGMVSYEGGWSPDYLNGNWFTSMTSPGATQASPCIVTLNTTNGTGNSEFGSMAGNPAAVGMAVTISGVVGMTQLNNAALGSCTFTNTSASIAATNTLLAGQAVTFTSTPPTPFAINTTYFVIATGLSGSAFQLSATHGGSAITATASGSVGSATTGWYVSAVGAGTITLDVDSSAFTAWSSGGTVTWMNSVTYSNTLRQKGGDTTANGNLNTKWYGLYAGLASAGFVAEFPSNFIYFGKGSVWFVLQPDIYAPLTPQWNSIVAAN